MPTSNPPISGPSNHHMQGAPGGPPAAQMSLMPTGGPMQQQAMSMAMASVANSGQQLPTSLLGSPMPGMMQPVPLGFPPQMQRLPQGMPPGGPPRLGMQMQQQQQQQQPVPLMSRPLMQQAPGQPQGGVPRGQGLLGAFPGGRPMLARFQQMGGPPQRRF